MDHKEDTLAVNVVVELAPASLESIVHHAKQMTGRNAKGHYKVDTADKVGQMISKFLREKDFESFVKDADNYD